MFVGHSSKLAHMRIGSIRHSTQSPGGLAQGNYSFVCKGALPKDGILFQPVIGEHRFIEQRIGSQ
jgi:hypothetical protein